MTLLDKINRVEYLLKHQPGRHDQQKHAGSRAVARSTEEIASSGAYVMSEIMQDDRMRNLAAAMAADGPIDDVQNVVEAIDDELPGFADVYMESNPDMAEGKLDVPDEDADYITAVADDMYRDYEEAVRESGYRQDIVTQKMTPERRAWEQKYYGREVGGFSNGFDYANTEIKNFVAEKISSPGNRAYKPSGVKLSAVPDFDATSMRAELRRVRNLPSRAENLRRNIEMMKSPRMRKYYSDNQIARNEAELRIAEEILHGG